MPLHENLPENNRQEIADLIKYINLTLLPVINNNEKRISELMAVVDQHEKTSKKRKKNSNFNLKIPDTDSEEDTE
jgi:hypothetical protein